MRTRLVADNGPGAFHCQEELFSFGSGWLRKMAAKLEKSRVLSYLEAMEMKSMIRKVSYVGVMLAALQFASAVAQATPYLPQP